MIWLRISQLPHSQLLAQGNRILTKEAARKSLFPPKLNGISIFSYFLLSYISFDNAYNFLKDFIICVIVVV